MDERTDAELLAATAEEPAAFGAFYRRYERSVLGFFMRCTRSAELAADLTAETFANALESRAGFRPTLGEPRAWLFGIARHVLSRSVERGRVDDRARRKLSLPVLVVDEDAIERIEAVASLDGDVLGFMDELPSPIRDAVWGRVVDEAEYEELAARLRCSPSVARKRVSRGLAHLRTRLEETTR